MHIVPTVRLATSEDEAGILSLCWQAHEERPERSLSKPKVTAMVQTCISGEKGLIGIIKRGDDVQAMVGLVISSAYCSEDLELYDWLVYVRRDCRHLRYLTPLLAFAEDQAVRLGLILWMGWIGDERAEAKSKAYQRRFAKFGEFYRFDPRSHARAA